MISIMLDTLGGQLYGFDDKPFKDAAKDVAYTKEEIDSKLAAVLRFKGIKATKDELPTSGNSRGDVWAVTENNLEFVWLHDEPTVTSSRKWEQLGPIHDLSAYYTKEQINAMLGTIPEGKTIMDLIGLDGTEGKSLKQLIDELTTRISTAESDIDSLEGRMTTAEGNISTLDSHVTAAEGDIDTLEGRADTLETLTSEHTTKLATAESNIGTLQAKATEIFNRVGNGPYKTPVEPQFLEDFEYYKKNADETFTLLVAGTDYNVGDAMREGVYRCYSDKNLSERMFIAEQTASGHSTRLNTVEGNITDLQNDVWTNIPLAIENALCQYRYSFTTSTLSKLGSTKSSTECWNELSGKIIDNRAIRLITSDCTTFSSVQVDLRLVTCDNVISTPEYTEETQTGWDYTRMLYFCSHLSDGKVALVKIKLHWHTTMEGEAVGNTVADSIEASVLGSETTADKVTMPENITLAGDWTQVGNVKLSAGTLQCQGWTVAKMFKEILNKTIKPTLDGSTAPSVSITFAHAGAYEVGDTVKDNYFKVAFNQGTYYQPWDGGSQADGTAANYYHAVDSAGATYEATTSSSSKTFTLSEVSVVDETSFKGTGYAKYDAGTPGVDNTGGSCSDVVRPAGQTADKSSSSITAFRYMYIGSTTSTDEVDETMIKGLTKFKTGAKTLTVQASGGDVTLVSGAKKIIVAIPVNTDGYGKTSCGGQLLTEVKLKSASDTPITSDYKAKSNISVSGKVANANMKDYKVWVYEPAVIGSGEIHSITIA